MVKYMAKVSLQKRERVALYDNIKFIMITLMVVGHFADVFTENSGVCQSIYLFIYAFHMPMMIFVSGLFYTNRQNIPKIMFYICSGFALKVSLSIVDLICSRSSTSFSLLTDAWIPWFMFVLASYQILMYIFKNINKVFLLIFCIILACFVGYDTTVGDYLYLSRMIVFFPFYLLGTMLSPKKIESFLNKYSKRFIGIAIVIITVWFFLCFYKRDEFYIYRHLFTGRNSFSSEILEYGPLARLLCYCITFLTGASLLALTSKVRISFISSLGLHTLNVYYWHWIIYCLADKFFNISNIFSLGKTGRVIFLLIAILLSVILSSVRVFDYPLNLIRQQCFKANNNT